MFECWQQEEDPSKVDLLEVKLEEGMETDGVETLVATVLGGDDKELVRSLRLGIFGVVTIFKLISLETGELTCSLGFG